MTAVLRSKDCGNSPKNAKAQNIALALMGVGEFPLDLLAEAATWDRPGGAVTGRGAICAAIRGDIDRIEIDQVVTHGKAGSVSGHFQRGGETRLFCHVIRFTNASANQIAQLVSFEHAG